ncbi:MAG: hypothetical protein GAK45_02080 [Pseudomonas citronellolis]|nr:MAG: hypothetical protein GAK45_02080 [Pseudomonas citronellolis]
MDNSIIPLTVSPSHWEYDTASSGGLTFMFVAGGGGQLILKDPQGARHSYGYGGIGVGAGFGAKLPKIGRVNLNVKGKSVGAVGAAESFPSYGKVFVSDALRERDLSADDFTGACVYIEGSIGLGVGGAGTAMLFGLDAKLLALNLALAASPIAQVFASRTVQRQLLQSAKGVLVMGGATAGLQAGGGGAMYVGGLF